MDSPAPIRPKQTPLSETSTHALWRSFGPESLLAPKRRADAIARDLREAVRTAVHSLPGHKASLRALADGQLGELSPLLERLPGDPGDDRWALFDLRMTLVLWCMFASQVSRNAIRSANYPAIHRLMTEGLMVWASHLTPENPMVLDCPNRHRTIEERRAVRRWRSERRRLHRLALAWATRCPSQMIAPPSAPRSRFFDRCFRPPAPAVPSTPEPEIAAEGPTRIVVAWAGRSQSQAAFDVLAADSPWSCLTDPLPLAPSALSPEALGVALTEEFPWMSEAIDRIADDLRLRRLSPEASWFHFRPLLLVGPPGCGKTRFALRLAERVGIGMRVVNLGGATDNRDLQGTARGYHSAAPSAVLRAIRDHRIANPLIFVDEVEKAGGSFRNGRPHDTLLAMLERDSARQWYDDCLCAPADLSAVNWLLAANDTIGIPAPLLSRLSVVRVERPSYNAFPAILRTIRADLADEIGIMPECLPTLDPAATACLAQAFAKGTDIRRIKSAVRRAMARGFENPTWLN